jgi:beta-glucanase (GH16 family)
MMHRQALSRRTLLHGAAAAVLSGFGSGFRTAYGRALPSDLPGPIRSSNDKWRLSFQDDFMQNELRAHWTAVRAPTGDSIRIPENVTVGSGELSLGLGRSRDTSHRRTWTAGYVKTADFRQRYGYFECEMRIASEAGVNNAFWLGANPAREGEFFELDVVEAKFPNVVQVASRSRGKVRSATYRHVASLATDFHRYGMLWNRTNIAFFFDDREILRAPNEVAHSTADIRLSNAVARFAGKNDGDVQGATTINWVRVYEQFS